MLTELAVGSSKELC